MIIAIGLCATALGFLLVRWGVSVISQRPTPGSDSRIFGGAAVFAAGGITAAVGLLVRLLAFFAFHATILLPRVAEIY